MDRTWYLGALVVLQGALAWQAVPALGRWLTGVSALGTAGGGGADVAQLVLAAVAVSALAWVLAFPALALLRHRQRGRQRFLGLPAPAVRLAVGGAVAFVAAVAMEGLLALVPGTAASMAARTLAPLMPAAVAVMAAGTLSAELLRRSVTPAVVRTRIAERRELRRTSGELARRAA